MKQDIHPQWYEKAKVTCACGQTFTTGSVLPEIKTDICRRCHPFFTGKEHLIDTEGLVEKFEKKRTYGQEKLAIKKDREIQDTERQKKEPQPKTLKEMLEYAQKKGGKR